MIFSSKYFINIVILLDIILKMMVLIIILKRNQSVIMNLIITPLKILKLYIVIKNRRRIFYKKTSPFICFENLICKNK